MVSKLLVGWNNAIYYECHPIFFNSSSYLSVELFLNSVCTFTCDDTCCNRKYFLWIIINKTWQGTRKNRLKMATVGSSFYMILSLILIYMLVTLEPAYPGDDPFMRAIGLFMGIVVTTVAFISCLIFTGFSIKKEVNEARF